MWLHYGTLALDIARERARELELAGNRYRLLQELGEVRGDAPPPRRPRPLRSIIARPVRAFSNAAHSVADAACTAATRIEGRTA